MKRISVLVFTVLTIVGLSGCETVESIVDEYTENNIVTEVASSSSYVDDESLSEFFTDRDLLQSVTTYDQSYVLDSNDDLEITEEGIYLITGEAVNTTIIVEVDSEEKVQLVFEDVSVINDNMPVVYVKSADKVFVTVTGENYFEVNGSSTVEDSNLDAAIFSKDDIVINGEGSLEIVSTVNGVTSKDDLKITGGTIIVESENHGLEANDSIRISDGDIFITAGNDALHSENDDEGLGYIYIAGGTLVIDSLDDAIRATTYIQIDGGDITINSSYEGLEATQVYINNGVIDLYSTDDGLNATKKTDLDVEIMISGGDITIEVGSGDTDGIDSNGDLTISGGTINITAPTSSIDVDGTVTHSGGTVIVNGTEVADASEIASSGGGAKHK